MKIKVNSKSVYLNMSIGQAVMLKVLLVIGRHSNEATFNKDIRENIIGLLEIGLDSR